MSLISQVLILDADMTSSIAILRSLASKNIVCDIASSTTAPLSRFSRYAKLHYQYPDPLTDSAAFVDFIVNVLVSNDYILIIPVTERSLIPLAESEKVLPWRDRMAIPDIGALSKVLDKNKTLQLATQCQIPIPFSHHIYTLSDLEALLPELSFPLVLKPGQSIPNAESRRQLSVVYAHDVPELVKLTKELLTFSSVILQQYVHGNGCGVELIADHGDIFYAFQHQRLHELPLTGGGSCYRKSVAVNPILLEASKKIIKALNWHGVAMVEFKWQPETNNYWLMEINGRFWGSLPLACSAGADFPYMLYELWTNKKRLDNLKYRENIYCRKLSADIYWYEQVIRRNGDKRLVNYPDTKTMTIDLLLGFHPTRHFFDVQCWYDPLPGLVDIYRIATHYLDRFYGIFMLEVTGLWHCSKWMQYCLQHQLKNARNVLFICYGNINRSAVAEKLAIKYFSNSSLEFDSAGFHPIANRPADPVMREIAANHMLDLSDHTSKTLSIIQLEKANLVFVMERQQYLYIKEHYPTYRRKVYLLGGINGQPDINDPYNQPENEYLQCFATIDSVLKKLAQL